jgi:hypothetical protein
MTNEPENNQEETEEKTFAEKVEDSVDFIVNMMNEGKANPKDVYPSGRYQGD